MRVERLPVNPFDVANQVFLQCVLVARVLTRNLLITVRKEARMRDAGQERTASQLPKATFTLLSTAQNS
jgi:hypothetical protein